MKQSESAFDKSTTAQQKNAAKAKNLTKQVENQEKKVAQLRKMTKESADKFGENSTQTLKWKEALADAETELNRLNKELDELDKSNFGEKLQNAGQGLQNIGSKVSSVGDTLTKNVTVPLAAIGAASVAAYNEVDDAMDIIVKKTGATGDELEAMQKSARKIAKTIPTSFEKSAKAVGEVNTRFSITGDELEDLSTYFLEFADLNDTDVSDSIDKVQKSMAAFGVETKDAKKVLDVMNATGQRTGVSMSSLSDSMVKNAASLQEMGLDAYSAVEFLGDLEVSGADASTVMMGLKTALKNAAAEGKSLPESLGEFETIMASSASDTEKLNAAVELFGSKAGPAIYEACKKGGLSFKGLSEDATKYFGNVQQTYEGVLGPESKLVTTMNSLKDTGAQIGETLLTILEPAVSSVGDYIDKLGEWFNGLDDNTKEVISKVGLATAAGGPILSGLGRVSSGIGGVIKTAGKILGSDSLGGWGGLAGPIGILALGVGSVAAALALIPEKAPFEGYEEFEQTMKKLAEDARLIEEGFRKTDASIKGIMGAADNEIATVQAKYDQLAACFNEDGSLREGMEQTANYLLNDLSQAFGADFSGSFGEDMQANIDILGQVNDALEAHVQKLRQSAVEEAYNKEFGEAYTRQAEAIKAKTEAQVEYDTAVQNVADALAEVERLEKEVAENPGDFVKGAKLDEARDNLDGYCQKLEEAAETLDRAGADAAQANEEVRGLDEALSLVAAGKIEESAEAVAKVGLNAQKAGEQVRGNLNSSVSDYIGKIKDLIDTATHEDFAKGIELPKLKVSKDWDKSLKTIRNDLKEKFGKTQLYIDMKNGGLRNLRSFGKESTSLIEKAMPGIMGQMKGIKNTQNVAVSARSTITGTLSGINASVGGVIGASSAASSARSLMQSVFNSPLAAKVSSVSGWAEAVRSAWSNMQSWFNSNPLVSYVREVKESQSSGWNWGGLFGHANGGFIDHEQLSWVGEGNKPEVIIPLSSQKRGRALSLYRQTGAILGVGGGRTVNNSTTNMGGINIVINTTPNQDANEIADIVSRKISAQVYSKGAVFG